MVDVGGGWYLSNNVPNTVLPVIVVIVVMVAVTIMVVIVAIDHYCFR